MQDVNLSEYLIEKVWHYHLQEWEVVGLAERKENDKSFGRFKDEEEAKKLVMELIEKSL